MRAFLNKSLGRRLLSAIIVIIVIALSAITAIAIYQERVKARQRLLSKGETLVGLLSHGSRMGIFAENRDLLKDVAAGIVAEPDVALVGVYTTEGKTLYEVNKASGRKDFHPERNAAVVSKRDGMISRETGQTLEFTKAVVLSGSVTAEDALYFDARQPDRIIGRVSIVLDKKALNQETLAILKRNGVLSLLFIVASVAVVAFSVRRITRPLEDLTETVRVIGSGEEAAPVPVTGEDEIAKLAEAFNAMVTERRRAEDQLRQAQKMEAVGRLTSGVAHDFNNILTAIVSYAHHLQVRLAKKEDPLASYAEKIIAAGDKAADLIRSLLVFSRKQILNAQAIDLSEIVSGHADLLARVAGKDVKLEARLAEDSLVVNADAGQMAHVIMNLASNARDAMPAGGPLTIATERVRLDHEFVKVHGYGEPGDYALLSVTDAGEGMDAATAKKIFEPFFTTKDQGKGTGLGLSIVYGIVKQHKGYIDVASAPGKGATFAVYLPLLDAGAAKASSAREDRSPGGSETILTAEDDDEARALVLSVLSGAGYNVIAASDGAEALRLFHEHQDAVDLLLLDMVLPIKNGMQVSVEAGKVRPGLKTIFLSAFSGDLSDGRQADGEKLHFLAKPVSPEKLLQKAREVLDG